MRTFLNCDCFDFLRTIPTDSVDVILTDPPYYKIVKNEWDNQFLSMEHFQKWCECLALEFARVLKPNGSFFWFGDDKNVAYCQVVFDKYFKLLNNLVWEKTNFVTLKGCKNVFQSFAPITERCLFYEQFEQKRYNQVKTYMRSQKNLIMTEKGFKTVKEFNSFVDNLTSTKSVVSRHYFADSQYAFPTKELYEKLQKSGFFKMPYDELKAIYTAVSRVWNNEQGAADVLKFAPYQKTDKFHPTQKSVELIKYLIERTTNKGNIILDCFAGSGTTGVAAVELGRDYLLCEKNTVYFEKAKKRIEEADRQKILL